MLSLVIFTSMSKYIIQGGNRLQGSVNISGNKNAVLPCMAATILTAEEVTLTNVPKIRDVDVMLEILQVLGARVNREGETLKILTENILTTDLPTELTNKLRGSVLLAGALLARASKVSFSHPGGDVIGRRAIEQHIEGFENMGYQVNLADRSYSATKVQENHQDIDMFLELPTVTGTENIILCAVLRKGQTVIRNAAQEPHVVDLCNLLVQMGANIEGVGSNTLKINGVDSLHGTEFRIGSDPNEFGTYAVAAAVTGGQIELTNCLDLDVKPIIWALEKMGIKFEKTTEGYLVSVGHLKALSTNFPFTANFWPGFPTDLISVMIVLATQAEGVSLIRDFIYESRMFFVDKLISMGANITIADPHRVVIYGPTKLIGREQETPDIRAGMALVLAGLVAHGQSTILKAELIERGYPNVIQNLNSLGAQIRCEEP